MRTAASRLAAFALLSLALAASCDRTPTTPNPQAPPEPAPEPFIRRIELIAPPTLAPGATTQLRVIGHRSDGSTQDITGTATLGVSAPDVLVVSQDGLLRALKLGESSVTAASVPFSSGREVVVVPDGTFRVTGRISESGTPTALLQNARVEVSGGPSTFTDGVGIYRLYGVGGNSRLRVSKPDYVSQEIVLVITDHHVENIALTLASPRLQVAGTYQMRIEVAPECRGQIPAPFHTRQYTADVMQQGARIEGTVSGANFSSNTFAGRVDAREVFLDILYDAYYYGGGDLIEVVDEQTYLVFWGQASLVQSGRSLTGGLWGSIMVFDRSPAARTPPKASCYAGHHLTLTR